ncbi:Transglutaminase-like superfamily protein [Nakamurella panacisegetis]|uniref:Transglutaminase-like superfamily protein n=1 Tax=Nakamurella panacisegetis TaxID=1090615 RepID=A0A1H0Q793_9ACTN|nr:DUF3488 and transglutaminase-like domain-containing protein [Nakamurella panacisegetis]SDP13262.1 Transglutaminase-like superfamily protein [Nakamurella panacisegetis]
MSTATASVPRPGYAPVPPLPTPPPTPPVGIGATFLAAAAVLTGSSALSAPIIGHSWVLPLIEVVAVIWLVGVGGRLIRLPTVATAGLQLAGFVIALTSLFTSSGIGGVLPNSAAVGEAGTLLSGAWKQIVETSPPAQSTPELSFLISLSIGLAAFLADFLVAEAKAPALVALPLLCLYSVPASIASTMLPWYSFAGPAVLYAALLAVTGHKDRRSGVRAGVGLAINGGAITILSAAVALVVAGSVTGIGTTGRLPHTSGSNNGTVGLSPFASLLGSLKKSDPVNVLTVTGLKHPDYFRTVSLTTWTPNKGWSLGTLSADVNQVDGELPGATALPTNATVTVTPTGYQDRFLPILTGTAAVSGLSDGWDFDSALTTIFRTDKIKPTPYRLSVDQTQPSAESLEQDAVVSGGNLTETGSLPAMVRDEAAQVTADAPTAYDKALALQQWFTDPANGFVYSLDVLPGNSGDALVDFLTNKQGYCEQYASAMAIMLRSLNIPSRVVVGFTQGVKQSNGSWLVTSHDAHAWVEVDFENHGWVRFDPTPPVAGQGGLQGFTQPTANPTTATSAATATNTKAAPTTNNHLDTTTKATKSSAVATQVSVVGGAGHSSTGWIRTALVVLAGLAVLIGLLFLPTVFRLRRRSARIRLARSGGPAGAVAAWNEIEDTAIDHGILPHSSESARITANRLARRAHLDDVGRHRLRTVVIAAESAWYGAPAGPVSSVSTASATANGRTEGPDGQTLVLDRAEPEINGRELVAGVNSIVDGLKEHATVPLTERLIPRSLRRLR